MSDRSITPEILLNAYASGVFPMADSRDDAELFWVDPHERGILPLNAFHIPRSLKKLVRQEPFTVTVDKCFSDVVRACAAPARGRNNTWISERIEELYTTLHHLVLLIPSNAIWRKTCRWLIRRFPCRCFFWREHVSHRDRGQAKLRWCTLLAD